MRLDRTLAERSSGMMPTSGLEPALSLMTPLDMSSPRHCGYRRLILSGGDRGLKVQSNTFEYIKFLPYVDPATNDQIYPGPAWNAKNNILVIGSPSSSINATIALHLKKGCKFKRLWETNVVSKKSTADDVFSSPVIVGNDIVFIATGRRGNLKALKLDSGEKLWSYQDEGSVTGLFAPPTVVDGIVLFTSWSGKLQAFSLNK
jgi:outer membrane protein assembly factor BamB